MKRLGQKNLMYSLLLACVMMLLLISYFIWMLPSLYVSYTVEQNLQAIKKQHQTFVETGSYRHVNVRNPSACFSIKIPFNENKNENNIEIVSKIVSVKITALDPDTKALLADIQTFAQTFDAQQLWPLDSEEKEQRGSDIKKKLDKWKTQLKETIKKQQQLPIKIQIDLQNEYERLYENESFQIHAGPGQAVIFESNIFDKTNMYTNYMAAERVADGIVISELPVITPHMEEIRPVVLQSVPMLCAVIFMLSLIFSQLYSNGIVRPVYKKMQDVNQSLIEENERQEMFLRASSHQLKTPITASLLLLDGMMGQIGKYKDRDKYLPKVKEQLLSMRRMVEEILSLNQSHQTSSQSRICLYDLVQGLIHAYRVPVIEKKLTVSVEGEQTACIMADENMLSKIIDNLLSNAVAYTPCEKHIDVILTDKSVVIRNEGVTIPNDILPHIFEPFVRGEHGSTSHGLGLYIAAYYAKIMGAALYIRNQEEGVESVLEIES